MPILLLPPVLFRYRKIRQNIAQRRSRAQPFHMAKEAIFVRFAPEDALVAFPQQILEMPILLLPPVLFRCRKIRQHASQRAFVSQPRGIGAKSVRLSLPRKDSLIAACHKFRRPEPQHPTKRSLLEPRH